MFLVVPVYHTIGCHILEDSNLEIAGRLVKRTGSNQRTVCTWLQLAQYGLRANPTRRDEWPFLLVRREALIILLPCLKLQVPDLTTLDPVLCVTAHVMPRPVESNSH
jgi:hypothetical protein